VKKKLLAGSRLQGSIPKPRKWPVERRVRKQMRAIFDQNCSPAVNGVRTKELIPVSDCWQRCSRRHRGVDRLCLPSASVGIAKLAGSSSARTADNLAVCVLSVRIEIHSAIG
jgi:hypothetical protein